MVLMVRKISCLGLVWYTAVLQAQWPTTQPARKPLSLHVHYQAGLLSASMHMLAILLTQSLFNSSKSLRQAAGVDTAAVGLQVNCSADLNTAAATVMHGAVEGDCGSVAPVDIAQLVPGRVVCGFCAAEQHTSHSQE